MRKLIKCKIEGGKFSSVGVLNDGEYIIYQNDLKTSTNQKLAYFGWLSRLSSILNISSDKLDLEYRGRFLSVRVYCKLTKRYLKSARSISDLGVKEFNVYIASIEEFLGKYGIHEAFKRDDLDHRDNYF